MEALLTEKWHELKSRRTPDANRMAPQLSRCALAKLTIVFMLAVLSSLNAACSDQSQAEAAPSVVFPEGPGRPPPSLVPTTQASLDYSGPPEPRVFSDAEVSGGLFEYASSLLREEFIVELQGFVGELDKSFGGAETQDQSVDWSLLVIGYTDGRGTDEYNLGLSQRRAEAVATWLVEHGVDLPIEIVGKGEECASDAVEDEAERLVLIVPIHTGMSVEDIEYRRTCEFVWSVDDQ
jgi:outer membrane protein OmpA-like peptidoglycan-associated protein